ncbi:MAG: RNA polymerase sigma factor [Bacteroidota bacterium]
MTEAQFTNLIQQNKAIVFKVIRMYIRHEDDAQDLFQEILYQAWRSVKNFKGDSKFSTWLYRVSLNTVLTFKRRAVLVTPHDDLASLQVASTDGEHQDEKQLLYMAIRSLNEVDRMIMMLHLDGYSNEETAEITGLTKNNVAVRLHRAREVVIEKVKAEGK